MLYLVYRAIQREETLSLEFPSKPDHLYLVAEQVDDNIWNADYRNVLLECVHESSLCKGRISKISPDTIWLLYRCNGAYLF